MASSSLKCCSTTASGQSNTHICASTFRSESQADRTPEIAMSAIVRLTQLHGATRDREHRLQRLQEILEEEEWVAITDWKKL
jgi:hypothetical protein